MSRCLVGTWAGQAGTCGGHVEFGESQSDFVEGAPDFQEGQSRRKRSWRERKLKAKQEIAQMDAGRRPTQP